MSGRGTPSDVGGDPLRQPMKRPAHSSHGDPGPSKRMSYYIKDLESLTARISDAEPVDVSAGASTASDTSQPGRTFGAEAALEYHGAVPSGTELSVYLACSHFVSLFYASAFFVFDAFSTVLVPSRIPKMEICSGGQRPWPPCPHFFHPHFYPWDTALMREVLLVVGLCRRNQQELVGLSS